jgi:hypothetical protein
MWTFKVTEFPPYGIFFTFEVSTLASKVGSLVIFYTRETIILKSAEKQQKTTF